MKKEKRSALENMERLLIKVAREPRIPGKASLLLIVVGFLMFFYVSAPHLFREFLNGISNFVLNYFELLAILFIVITAALRMLEYLSVSESKSIIESEKSLEGRLERRIRLINDKVDFIASGQVPNIDNESDKIYENFRDFVERSKEEFGSDIIDKIKNDFGEELREKKKVEDIENNFGEIVERIKTEIDSLTRRGNLSLIIGIATTSTAVSILAVPILFPSSFDSELTPDRLLYELAPRFTLAIFIEVFSFFFLRLYSNGLRDIKYYQNELTNLELKSVALQHAVSVSADDSVRKILDVLMTTDRNFVLKAGESTIDLERTKLDHGHIRDTIRNLKGMTKLENGKKATG